ncbi:Uma2 family endonuclease [uncultured Thiodictyon sp.]|jgi:Uma2 family endonuclease|uniref:Uma2 family endonuclease n=1 Tax=uncultured Thiodictyon sp. TaxID=1846217 RepID=UPI0025F56E2D|nr:Uma2 family endonuclease [uncultured Thiodictyon sp.]
MSLQPKPQLQFADWLAAERASDQGRTEFLDGEVFAMAGGSEAHNLICGNVLRELGTRFKGRPCYVYTSDMKVRIESANLGTYPDVMAVCGERRFWDERRDVITNPTLIVEVLSDSTESYDRGDKFAYYRGIPSLSAYLLLSQHRVGAELFLRQGGGDWLLRTYSDLREGVPLIALDAVLPLSEVYDKVEFGPES